TPRSSTPTAVPQPTCGSRSRRPRRRTRAGCRASTGCSRPTRPSRSGSRCCARCDGPAAARRGVARQACGVRAEKPLHFPAKRLGPPPEAARTLAVMTESASPTPGHEIGTVRVKRGLAEMLKGGVIMDVVTPEQAKIAEDAGAAAVMALERVPADIRRD